MKLSFLFLAGAIGGATTLCDLCRPSSASMLAMPSDAAVRGAPSLGSAAADTVTLKIDGMTCAGCTIATRKVLERLNGVRKADVSYEKKTAIVTYDAAQVTTEQMIAAVATLKYTATVVR